MKLAKIFRWRPHGSVMSFFRENASLEYFSGGFVRKDESLLPVQGSMRSWALVPPATFLHFSSCYCRSVWSQHPL
jgi:hypothetical protein